MCWQEKCHFRWGHWPKQQPKHRPLLFFSLNLTLLFLYSLYLCLTSPLSLFFHWPCLFLGLWVHFISSSSMLWKRFAETQYLFFSFFFKLGSLFPGWWNGGWCKDKDHRLFKHLNWSLPPHTSVMSNLHEAKLSVITLKHPKTNYFLWAVYWIHEKKRNWNNYMKKFM